MIKEIVDNENQSKDPNASVQELCEGAACSSSSSGGTSIEDKNAKRTFLEVNNAEKYKQFMLKPLETKRFKPSEALSKVRDFLPILKDSTTKLLDEFKQNPDLLNIENVGEDEEHIEMNLAMVSESEGSSNDSDSEEDDEDIEQDEESSHDEDHSKNSSPDPLEDFNLGFKVKIASNELKMPKTKAKKPFIKMIDSKEEDK